MQRLTIVDACLMIYIKLKTLAKQIHQRNNKHTNKNIDLNTEWGLKMKKHYQTTKDIGDSNSYVISWNKFQLIVNYVSKMYSNVTLRWQMSNDNNCVYK